MKISKNLLKCLFLEGYNINIFTGIKIINSLIANTFMKILIFPLLIISQIIFSQAGFLKLGNNIKLNTNVLYKYKSQI